MEIIGFQSRDGGSDVRGGGVYSLLQILRLSELHRT